MCLKNKIAILIDGDNAQSKFIENYISEASSFGKITIKRIYADWTNSNMNGWKNVLNENAVRAMQKFAYTKGKNSTDTALIIDAMDILLSGKVDGICIVSSDSDYTGIANRIREEGLFVMGIGRYDTPKSFVNACEKFIYTEIFNKNIASNKENSKTKSQKLKSPKIIGKIDLIGPLKNKDVQIIDFDMINSAYENVVDVNTELALLSRFSEALRKIDTTFDYRNYGFNSIKEFCENLSDYKLIVANDNMTYSIKKIEQTL